MLSCREVTQLVTDYAEGRLSLADRLRFQLHLGMCRHCRRYVRQMKATVEAVGRLPPPELPPDTRAELMRRFERWRTTRE